MMAKREGHWLTRLWAASIRRQLILGVALVHAALMTIFVFDLVARQRDFLNEWSLAEAESMARTLAANSTSWVLANDLIGLEEVVASLSHHPDSDYVMVLDTDGRVLAHSTRRHIGYYVSDPQSRSLLEGQPVLQNLHVSPLLVDVAAPILANERLVGWARVGLSRSTISRNLQYVTLAGLGYTVFAILVGTVFAVLLSRGLTQRLKHLVDIVRQTTRGARHLRSEARGVDEIGQLSRAFNQMLDAMVHAEKQKIEEEKRNMQLENEARMQHSQKLESLGVLAGGIAHDFNNLLMTIHGNTDLALLETEKDSPARESLQSIAAASRQAADLTRQLLAYSGKGRFVIQPVQLSEKIQETLNLLQTSISKKSELELRLKQDLPYVAADVTQVQQVIMNLIINASEALEEKPGKIVLSTGVETLSLSRIDQIHQAIFPDGEAPPAPGEYVFLEITDTGCGMTEDQQVRMFEPFFSTKFTGRGLGMAAVLGIIRGHEGLIQLQSALGAGTTMRVYFPVMAKQPEKKSTRMESASPQTMADAPDKTILVVDDEPAVRSVAARMLERLGYGVLEAGDGAECLEIFRADPGRIDAVLMDLTMPKMDGYETCATLRQLDAEVAILLSSGFDEKEVDKRFKDTSIQGFVQKPYTLEKLRQKTSSLFA